MPEPIEAIMTAELNHLQPVVVKAHELHMF
jgi:hypothetical protein